MIAPAKTHRQSSLDAEVLVVGAGPAGATAAGLLAERGHDVLCVDRSPEPRSDIVCTGIVGREAWEKLDLPQGTVMDVVRRARFLSPSGVEVTYRPPEPLAWVVDRTRFDAALAEWAVAAGARLRRGLEAREVRRDERGVVVRFRSVENAEAPVEIRARALVVATGHQRWLHKQAGLGTPPGYVHGVHADLPFTGLDGAELYFGTDVAPGFFAWAIPFGPGEARLGVLAPQGSRQYFRRFLELEPIRARLGLNLSNGGREKARRAVMSRGIVQGPVTPSFADRVLAVGEAAGQVKTTTAGGIYYGMIGAEIAADVLDEALRRDRLEASDLSSYETRWRKRLGREIETGLDLQAAVRDLEDGEIDALFRALNDGLGSAVRQVVRFDWHRPALKILLRKLKGRGAAALAGLAG